MVVKEFNVGIDKKQNNTIISNVYKDLLKIKYDEVIDLNIINVNHLKYGEIKSKIYHQFYHSTTYNILKKYIEGVDEKPIIFFDDLEVIDEISNEVKNIIDDELWELVLSFCDYLQNELWLGKSFRSISKENNKNGISLLNKKFNHKQLKSLWEMYCDSVYFRIDYTKHFFKTQYDKIIEKHSHKLKWGGKHFYEYFINSESYIIEILSDGRGIIYDSKNHFVNDENLEFDVIMLSKDFIDELYFKIERHRLKLHNRINSYCGWKIKQLSFRKYREKFDDGDGVIRRIIRYMIVKEYDLHRWCWKLYGDLYYRDLISVWELLDFKNKFYLHTNDFKIKIKNELIGVLSKYDYRNKPKVIKVDTNKYFRIRKKYKQYLNI